MSKRLAKIFEDTRNKSRLVYIDDTRYLLNHTFIYPDGSYEIIPDSDMNINHDMRIKVISGGSVSTAYNIKNSGRRVAMLNFADAKRPGGWVIEGAQTQEENICRCTNLYETLIQKKCLEGYYNVNMAFGIPDAENHYIEPYTDTLIYSENVAIFKDDVNYNDLPVKYVDVITCPAPCGGVNTENVLMRRMEKIIKVAYAHKVTHLILGAWGCGAFGQNPVVVANCFKSVLDKYPVFDSVIFAIRNCGLDRYNKTSNNYSIFKEILG